MVGDDKFGNVDNYPFGFQSSYLYSSGIRYYSPRRFADTDVHYKNGLGAEYKI